MTIELHEKTNMTAIDIEYCALCGLLDRAIKTQARLLNKLGRD